MKSPFSFSFPNAGFVMATGDQHSTGRDTALIFFVASGGMMAAPAQMQPLAMLGRAVILEAHHFETMVLMFQVVLSVEWWFTVSNSV